MIVETLFVSQKDDNGLFTRIIIPKTWSLLCYTYEKKNRQMKPPIRRGYIIYFSFYFPIFFPVVDDLGRDEAKHNATRCWKSHVTVGALGRATFDTAFMWGRAIMRFTTAALRPGRLNSVSGSFFFAPMLFFFFFLNRSLKSTLTILHYRTRSLLYRIRVYSIPPIIPAMLKA